MAKEEKLTFEQSLEQLEQIVQQLEQGDVPLETALEQFQKGIQLSKTCQKTLENAEKTLTKIMTDENQEVNFEASSESGEQA